jgi:hypothetical protein
MKKLHEIWYMECAKLIYGRFTNGRCKRTIKIQVRFSGYIDFYGKGNVNLEWGIDFFVHKRIISAAKMAECVSDRMSYVILRGH